MAVFNVSFANKNFTKSTQDYGFLIDQLDIKENQLAADGKLSPGDYALLKSEAQKLYTHPGLTPAQRSNVEVKISGYEKANNLSTLKDSNDISQLNSDVKNDMSTIGLKYANNPEKYLQAKTALLAGKIDKLSSAIEQMRTSGDDPSNHYNELSTTINDYNDSRQALNDVQTYDKSGTSKSSYAAYLVTNPRGEVTDIKVEKIGTVSGYLQTNGIYGGLPVYGKATSDISTGVSKFKLGSQVFTQTNAIDPASGNQQKVLVSGSTKAYGLKGANVEIDPSTVSTQGYVPPGGWIEGSKGFIYKRSDDGQSYTKYINSDQTKLGINPGDIIKVPTDFEQNILKNVKTTVDGNVSIAPPTPSVSSAFPSPAPATVAQPAAPATPTPAPTGTPRTPSPIDRAASSVYGTANKVMDKAKGFFQNLFNQ